MSESFVDSEDNVDSDDDDDDDDDDYRTEVEKLENPTQHRVSESTHDEASALTPRAAEENTAFVEPFVLSDDDDDDDDDDIRRGIRTPLFFQPPQPNSEDSLLPGAVREKSFDTVDLVVAASQAAKPTKVESQANRRDQQSVIRDLTTDREHTEHGSNS